MLFVNDSDYDECEVVGKRLELGWSAGDSMVGAHWETPLWDTVQTQ